ncbi:MAG TPA: GNAT family N-acetyltransferase [Candidatus Limnocylindria bacterium]|nr:GNAT family N-acetyltransferase [Candidatus Limnocylindria bacterium]
MSFERTADRDAVLAFYREELGRDVDVGNEELFVARSGDDVVGAVRLYPEAGTLLLRTMVMTAALRGRGIGRQLLRFVEPAIGPRECYCFPWTHLEAFYGDIGFRRISDEQVPSALRHRFGTPDTIVMRRTPRP